MRHAGGASHPFATAASAGGGRQTVRGAIVRNATNSSATTAVSRVEAEPIWRYWEFYGLAEEQADLADVRRDAQVVKRQGYLHLLRFAAVAFTLSWAILVATVVRQAGGLWLGVWASPIVVLLSVLATEKLALLLDRG